MASNTVGANPSKPENPSESCSDSDTVFAGSEYERERENLRNANRQGLTQPTGGIDVQKAEEEFAVLSKELSRISEKSKRPFIQAQNGLNEKGSYDVESGSEDKSAFDLEAALHGSRDAEAAAGIRPKRIGVIWDGLTVRGMGGVKYTIPTFPDAVIGFFNLPATIYNMLGFGKKGEEIKILRNFRGVAMPGEMVLVLGKPSSGCTTFLKVIANQRFGYTGVDGEVLYGPFDSDNFAKRYRGEAVYNQEDDVHHPSLTVEQTLGFALDTKTPGKRPAGLSKIAFKRKVIDLLLKMFNIEHTANTVVGNQFIRGVSGGERKRVSIAEMMITAATVLAWDNTTRGLDASTALDFAKSLRIMTNIYKTTTFVSLYQASENIYNQFDKVMVLDEGHQVFFGPIHAARAYFEGLGFKEKPRQTTPDYLTGFLRYSVPFHLQIFALMKRQFLIKWQDKFSLTVSWVTSISIAIIIGTVWLKLPATSSGAFTRGGLLFVSLLFNAFNAFGELASTMVGRPIINKQRAFTFYRPSALWIAQVVVDMAFSSAQIFVFSIIVYFMCGLVLEAGAFFTFVLIIITGYLAMTLFFRTVGCLCPDFDYALKGVSVLISFYVLTSGYLIQWHSQKVWLRWIFYINPLGLGFSSLMINEFRRLTMKCESDSLIPAGPGYSDIAHQVCTLPGSNPGSATIPGSSYIGLAFNYQTADQWRNWGIIVVLIAAFLFANAFLGEVLTFGAGGKTVTFFAKESNDLKELNEKLMRQKENRQQKRSDNPGSDLQVTSKSVLTWEDLCYEVPVPGGTRRLLNGIYGYVEPGKLTALMGASGAGKTTLLDVLASRKNIGVITGDVLVDGRPRGTAFQRGTSYAEQLDVHEATQTVREALRFSATLRQPYATPESEKFAYVEEIISLLELENLADAIIGTPETGLSVEERKRVTIGVELAAKPQLLLFLDEPTSGLDSQSAFNIVRFLRKLAAAGQAILCTIHQPNSALFENFDRLLLLQRGGECVYFGDIGKDANVLIDYFHRNGADCPPKANPAEWMLDAIGAGQAPRIGSRDWGDIWRTSPELANVKAEIVNMKSDRIRITDGQEVDPESEKEYATPLWHQIKVVCRRTNLSFWRSPNYGFTRLYSHVAVALITGLTFLNLNNSRTSLQYRVFVIFQVTVLPALILAQVEPKYDLSRLIFYRESAAKAYRQFPFALAMVLAELPYSILCAVCFYLPLYFMPGLSNESSRAGYQFLMVLITEIFSVTLGQVISALTPSTFTAVLLNPPVIVIFVLLCGVAIPKPQIPKFWRVWLHELDPFTRLVSGMVVTELHGQEVKCTGLEMNRFTAPSGETCGSYMEKFFANNGPGYLASNATDMCEYCAYKYYYLLE
ncbi:BMR1 [Trichophyton equinum CBS 127.97]|uniref:BMR1 n=1 Tax=Trichophyton equinum (strain ATCC MYA-4606 / CBS 127.97) TaxID=559882 RepID=F2PTY6_TRIEC|nr:BMR1 [Trichophyton equinum CBS 127.97]